MDTYRVAVIGARWPDISIECDVLETSPHDVACDPGATREAVLAAAADAEVILAGPRPRFDAGTLEQLRCRGIVRYGVGYDIVDLEAANRLGIMVATVPEYGTEAVALHALTLALTGLRRILDADRMVKAGTWDVQPLRPLHLPSALAAGVVGFGRIGRRLAEHLRSIGFGRVLAYDPGAPIETPGVETASLEELLAACDVVSLHAPARPDGAALLGPAEFDVMRPGSILVNTARGSLIDVDALVVALRLGRPAVAALDVFDPEPAAIDRFAPVIDQIIATPHMAWYSEESERDLRMKAAAEAKRMLDGAAPLHPVSTESET